MRAVVSMFRCKARSIGVGLIAAVVGAGSCKPARDAAVATDASPGEHRRFGEVMTEVGRRFERSGRGVAAGRWELADYDVGEIAEIFEGDLPNAVPPGEVRADLHLLQRTLAGTLPADLQHAVASRDRRTFEAEFARAAAACNACHQAAGKAFIQIPGTIGSSVPVLDAVGGVPPTTGTQTPDT